MNKTIKSVLDYLKLQADVFIKSTLVYIFTRLLIRVSFNLSGKKSFKIYKVDQYDVYGFAEAAIPLEMLPIFLAGVCAIVLLGRKN